MPEERTNVQSQNNIKNDIREYVEKRIELISIEIAEQVSLIIANSFQLLIGLLLLNWALFFILFALSFFVGNLLESVSLGFVIVSLPLFLGGFIFLKKKSKKVTEKIQSDIIGKVIDKFESGKEKINKNNNQK